MINARAVFLLMMKIGNFNNKVTHPYSMRKMILLPPPPPSSPGETLGYSFLDLEQNPVLHFIGILCPEEEQNVGSKI